ncbi:MAG: DUF262 domain-containing protein, partial [bacterium]
MSKTDELTNEISTKAKEIHTDAYPMSIGELMSIYRDGELDIHPEFQRFFRWSQLQKSKFIESILLGIPIPSIFVSQREDGVWDVVDGVQRLSTIFEFTGILRDRDKNTLPHSQLVGTEYLPCLDGMVWQDDANTEISFPNSLRLDFKRQKLDLKIIKKESDENTKYDLFERINTLGSKLSDQEVRNCLLVMINPDMYRWLEELAEYEPFRDTTSLTDRTLLERYDIELILRFLVLSREEETALRNVRDVADFVTRGMRMLADDRDFNQDFERSVFEKTFSNIFAVLGPGCFTRVDSGRGRGGFLISVFEVVAAGLGWQIRRYPDKTIDGERLKQAYDNVFKHETFREYSKSGKS